MTNWKSAQPLGHRVRRMRRREFMFLLAGATTAPRALRAQQKAMPVIGFLGSTSPGPFAPFVAAFHQGLSETGYIEGKSVTIEYRWAEGRFDRLPALAADLVSLARPGGNVTGFSLMGFELQAKRFELVSELVPQARVIALLVNPSEPVADALIREVQEAARTKNVQLSVLWAGSESEIDAAFGSLLRLHAGALVVVGDPFFDARHEQLVALAARHAVPTIYQSRIYAAVGGLISYGPSIASNYRQAGIYAGRILKGEKPADLPVQQPAQFELVINLKTAKALGLTVPPSILAQAEEVIE